MITIKRRDCPEFQALVGRCVREVSRLAAAAATVGLAADKRAVQTERPPL